MANERTPPGECYSCGNRRTIPGDCHSMCVTPDWNVALSACDHAINNGWWWYPFNFDPAWKTIMCKNWREKGAIKKSD